MLEVLKVNLKKTFNSRFFKEAICCKRLYQIIRYIKTQRILPLKKNSIIRAKFY